MTSIYANTDKLMLKRMIDETEVGYYATAVHLCGMWTFILSAIIDSLYPTIVSSFKKDKELFENKNRQLYAIVFYVSIFVSVMFCIFGNFGINLLYGEDYLPSAAPLKVITWYTAFAYFGVARNAWVVCNEKQKYLKYIYAVATVLNVLLNFLLIPIWGGVGAAVASLVTQICTSIILPFCIKNLRPNAKLILEAIMLKKVFVKDQDRLE